MVRAGFGLEKWRVVASQRPRPWSPGPATPDRPTTPQSSGWAKNELPGSDPKCDTRPGKPQAGWQAMPTLGRLTTFSHSKAAQLEMGARDSFQARVDFNVGAAPNVAIIPHNDH